MPPKGLGLLAGKESISIFAAGGALMATCGRMAVWGVRGAFADIHILQVNSWVDAEHFC